MKMPYNVGMKQSIFFDLDGTLWDAIPQIQQSWNQTMKEMNQPFSFSYDLIKSTMGLTPLETLPITFPGTSKEVGMKLFQECIKGEIRFLKEKPGILYPHEEEVLSLLSKKYPLYIVSNSDKGYIENYLSSCHMEKHFQGHLCAGDTNMAKWQNILLLKEKENIDEVIYLGDTDKDRIESMKANVKFIHASYGFGKIEEEVEKIASLTELPNKAEELFSRK